MKAPVFSLILLSVALLNARAADPAAHGHESKSEAGAIDAKFKTINVADFEKLRADTNVVVLDVRTPAEFAAGHMAGATNIDVNAPDFAKKVSALDPSKTYLVHCAAGIRSAKACTKMSNSNFLHLYNLEGGMRAWEQKGNKPVK